MVDAEGWKAWQPPQLLVPAWCDQVSAKFNNDKWARQPNHPCAFLRNETAAAVAAAAAASDSGWPGVGAAADTGVAQALGGG